jgi:hypothetical protein
MTRPMASTRDISSPQQAETATPMASMRDIRHRPREVMRRRDWLATQNGMSSSGPPPPPPPPPP